MALVCIAKRASAHAAFVVAEAFAVNILAEEQKHLSQHFSGKVADRFHGVTWRRGESGAPLLDGALAYIECLKRREIDAGDHTILLGEVIRVDSRAGRPLIYFESGYRSLE
jgi:flavin reductase ActVB